MRRGALACLLSLLAVPAGAAEVESVGVFVASPYHSDECNAAEAEACRRLAATPRDPYWQQVRAEALLCRALSENNPRLARSAARGFRRILAGAPTMHAAIGLSDALRLMYPASASALAELRRAQALTPPTATALQRYLATNARAVAANRAGCEPSTDTTRWYEACPQRGPREARRALRLLSTSATRRGDRRRWLEERAELRRGEARFAAAISALRAALRQPVEDPDAELRQALTSRVAQIELQRRSPPLCDLSPPRGAAPVVTTVSKEGAS